MSTNGNKCQKETNSEGNTIVHIETPLFSDCCGAKLSFVAIHLH